MRLHLDTLLDFGLISWQCDFSQLLQNRAWTTNGNSAVKYAILEQLRKMLSIKALRFTSWFFCSKVLEKRHCGYRLTGAQPTETTALCLYKGGLGAIEGRWAALNLGAKSAYFFPNRKCFFQNRKCFFSGMHREPVVSKNAKCHEN